MSVKHIKEEYQRICNDYTEMLDTVKELEIAVSENIVSQEQLDNIKESLDIIKTNYMRWQYIIFLLDKPNKKSKQKRYNKKYDKLNKSESEENREALDQFKDKIKSLNNFG